MRTRTRNLSRVMPGGADVSYENFDTKTRKWLPSNVDRQRWSVTQGYQETIEDVLRDPFIKRKWDPTVVNPVGHSRMEFPAISTQSYGPVYVNTKRRYYVKYVGFQNQGSAFVNPAPSFWVTSALPHREAADFFNAGGVANEVLLPNLLLELPQSLNVVSLLKTRLWNSKTVLNGVWDASKDASDKFIAYNFGIKPFIADIRAIAAYSEALQKRLEWLLDNQGKSVSLDYRASLLKPPASVPSHPGYWWKVVEYSQTYHAFARWTVNYDPVKAVWEKLRFFNRYFSTSKFLSAAYEAIPFSFVFDWVSNLGDLLKQLELPSSLRSDMQSVGWSQKQKGVLEGFMAHPTGGPPVQLARIEFKDYIRRPGLPLSLTSAFNTQTMTGKQQALAFALIHQKVR